VIVAADVLYDPGQAEADIAGAIASCSVRLPDQQRARLAASLGAVLGPGPDTPLRLLVAADAPYRLITVRDVAAAGKLSGDPEVLLGLFAPELMMHEFDSEFADMRNSALASSLRGCSLRPLRSQRCSGLAALPTLQDKSCQFRIIASHCYAVRFGSRARHF